jgi:hypothetical protein
MVLAMGAIVEPCELDHREIAVARGTSRMLER